MIEFDGVYAQAGNEEAFVHIIGDGFLPPCTTYLALWFDGFGFRWQHTVEYGEIKKYIIDNRLGKTSMRFKIQVTDPEIYPNGRPLPATGLAAGADLRSVIDMTLEPGDRALFPTGVRIALPPGYEAQVRPRSGLALKQGLSIVNTPGTIDADYRGDIGVILINHSRGQQVINRGDRIAQLVINKIEPFTADLVASLDETERGEGGFGSTGTN